MYLPARSLSITGLGIIRGISIRGALVAVLVLGGPGLPGKPWWHPVDGHPGHPLELHVLQGDDQEPWPGSGNGDKGGKNQDLSKDFMKLFGFSVLIHFQQSRVSTANPQ